ncbi:MAG: hypothetical protein IK142_00975 [Clostridiales bacterium]|nr:hypothetical protein [Clostridiales bacterium]
MKNFNDRILKVLAIIISINLVVYGGFDPDDEEDLALLFADASVAEVDTYEELTAAHNNVRTGGTLYLTDTSEEGTGLITGGFANSGGGIFNDKNGVPSGPRFILPFVFATITTYA